jgi:LPXTG-site transpeptidase (sortase) family protein
MTRLLALLTAAFSLLLVAGCGSSAEPVARNPETVASPTKIEIPSLRAESSLIWTGLNPDRTIQVPDVHTPMQASWYTFSSKPGDPGPAVILGHVDGDRKPGIFYQLHTMKPGQRVIIERSDGTRLTYAVTKVWKTDKDEFPADVVYGATPGSELRLITCGGAWEGGQTGYADNIIVNARLI